MISWLCKICLRIWGFRVAGDLSFNAPGNKTVIAVVPHTHWKDFFLGVFVRSAYGIKTHFVAKSELFEKFYGSVLKAMGGMPVVRGNAGTNYVDAVVKIFDERESFCLSITPEGTRKKVRKLHTGFYYIARGARAKIVIVHFDVGNKTVRFLPPFEPGDDTVEDLKKLEEMASGIEGFEKEYSFESRGGV